MSNQSQARPLRSKHPKKTHRAAFPRTPEAHQRAVSTNSVPADLFSGLLREAVSEPGIISAAYRAFHSYSLGNQILAASQLIERGMSITPVASFQAWKTKGRIVKKGEKAIRLFMPMMIHRMDRDEATGEDQEIRYQAFFMRPNWFSLDQTEGKTCKPETEIPGWDRELALQALGISEVRFEYLNGNCQGYAIEMRIAINPLAVLPHKTRFHELAHIVLGHTAETALHDDERTPRNLREVEAESVAYLMCCLLDLPGKFEARGYIQSWLDGEQINEKTARRIFAAADRLLKVGHPKIAPIGQWDAVDMS